MIVCECWVCANDGTIGPLKQLYLNFEDVQRLVPHVGVEMHIWILGVYKRLYVNVEYVQMILLNVSVEMNIKIMRMYG